MVEILVAGVLMFALIALVAAVSAELTRPLWRRVPALGICFAIIGVATVAWLQFLVSWANPVAGRYFAFAWVITFVLLGGTVRVWRIVRENAPIFLIAFGFLLAYLGLTYLWVDGAAPYDLTALRFSFGDQPYPVDNALSWLMAARIQGGESTHGLMLDWNGGDRPPLQAGPIIAVEAVFSSLGFSQTVLSFAVGVALQLLWVPALWALLRVMSVDRRVTAMAVVFSGATATMLINTVYTWPKLLSAALVIASLTILIALLRRLVPLAWGLPLAASSFTLAMLCHGAAALLLPAIGVLGVLALVRNSQRVRAVLATVAVVAVVYLPWTAYQRFVDPPGDRLLKWHLAGVVNVDDRSFPRALLDSYASLSLPEWVANKLTNLATIVDPNVFAGLGGTDQAEIGAHRFHEYYNTTGALSLTTFLLVGIAISVIVQRIRRRPVRNAPLLKLMLLLVPCILLWALVFFQPGGTVVHQGSHVWILVFFGCSFAWIAQRWKWAGIALIVAQAAVTLWFYVPFYHHTEVRPAGVVSLVVGVVVLIVALRAARRSSQAAEISGTTTRNTRPAAMTRKPEVENRAS